MQIIREDRNGLEHVEALLALRGCNLGPVPRSGVISFRKNELRRLILAALADGPQPLRGIAAYIAGRKPDVPYQRAYVRASCVLARMRRAGLVEHERPVWRAVDRGNRLKTLTPPAANTPSTSG